MNKTGIISRWLKYVFSIILIALIVFEAIVIGVIISSVNGSLKSFLEKRAEINIKFFRSHLENNSYNFEETAHALIQESIDIKNLKTQISNADGFILVSSDGYSPPEILIEKGNENKITIHKSSFTKEKLISMTVPLKDSIGKTYGYIIMTSSMKIADRQSSLLVLFSVIISLFVVAMAYISGFYFIRSILHPVTRMTKFAQLIAKGDFSVRIKKKHDDEIGVLSDSINNMASELSKIDKMKNDFISSTSHELRTPLTAIRGWNETLLSLDPKTDFEMINTGLNIIDVETERLANMVEELLDYSKIQSGRLVLNIYEVNLLSIITETIMMFTQKATQSGMSLVYNLPPFDMKIEGDAARLKQVFINIIDNSIKHSKPGGKIEIMFFKIEGGFSVAIKDYGNGIKEEDLPFVTERFYKGTSTKAGSGLGLAISNEVVKLHKGYFDIYSKENEGTTVVVSLPKKYKNDKKI